MFFIIGIFYNYIVKNITERAIYDFEVITSKTVTQIDDLIYDMDRTALQIAANPNILFYFSNVDDDTETNYFTKSPSVAPKVVQLLNSYNFKKDANMRICLYNNLNDFIYSALAMTTLTAIEDFFESDNFYDTQKYFAQNNVFSMYRKPQNDILNDSNLPSPRYFSVVREIKDYSSNSNKVGYVEVQQSVAYMDKIFKDLGDEYYSLIIDRENNIIYKSDSLKPQEDLTEINKIVELVKGGDVPFGVSLQKNKYVTLEKIDELDLQVMFITRQNSMLEPLYKFRSVLVFACLVISLIVIFTEIIIANRFSRPLVELSKSIKDISIDNLKLDIVTTNQSDELQQLKVAFNRMLSHLKQSINKQIISETNELKSHLFALQSQMNPHFIYNILGIISIEAQQDGNMKTVNMCSKLSRMLGFSSHMGNGFCTLEEELKNADNYMTLMKERYEELFEYMITVDENIKKIPVPKLIVQPICENSFKHAFKEIEGTWKINVRAYETGNRWFVEISDNGKGFAQEQLENFEKMVSETTVDNIKEKLEDISIGGLCILNIFIRLKICYGDDYIFGLSNSKSGSVDRKSVV